ncbi:rho GTPase-activating protein 32 [Gastrophryne carolinensis]
MMKSSLHLEEDDFVPELQRSIHPRERPDWEETISAMARGADIPVPGEFPIAAELPPRSCGNTASMKVRHVKKISFTKGHFPKLAECAHFHYENVDFGSIQFALTEEQNEVSRNGCDSKELVFLVQVACQGRSWIVKRSYEDFRVLDKHLHLCIYDRRFSQLSELPRADAVKDSPELVTQMLMAYLSRLSVIAGNKINCGPALTWMEIDNKGNHLLVHEESSINVPAIAAAHVIKRYNAQAPDELSFEVGDIVSVIDMPPKELTTWWRGKHGFQVGFFPSECVELINDKVPQSMTNSVPKPVSPAHGMRPASWCYFPPLSRKHGKLITFLRTFMKSRPSKQKLKQRGILRERVFGCDLGEHLLNSAQDVPQVLRSCTDFIEKYGIVDGIYRLSGIASNIQKLRHEFDSEQIPDLTKDVYIQDIHCVGSLCKLYFRELPNPLLTYQLYEKFSDAVSAATDEERLVKIHDVIQQLPPPHYRTLEFLMRHLSRLATYCSVTNMHTKNLAIVWAPNLLRSKQIESACFSGTAAFMEVRIQSVVVEFILNHVEVLFSPKLSSVIREGAGHTSLSRPKSLLVSSPSTKLLSLEEAQARTQAQINSPVVADSKYIEVGEGPAALQGRFHTVIDFPSERKRPPPKMKKSPVGNWRSFFNLGKPSSSSSSMSKRKLTRNPSEPTEMKAMAMAGGRGDTGTMRSAKSEESLSSLHAAEVDSKLFRPRRPRSSSDALSASYNGDLLDVCNRYNSYDNLPHDQDSDEGLVHIPGLLSSSRSQDEEDLSPPDMGVASLDFDPMSFQCSPPRPDGDGPDATFHADATPPFHADAAPPFHAGTAPPFHAGATPPFHADATPPFHAGATPPFHADATPPFHADATPGGSSSKERIHMGAQTPNSGHSSEPMSPFQERLISPFLTPDRSPAADRLLPKAPSFAEKVAQALSPKSGRKAVRSPPLIISDPVSVTLPGRVSEMFGVFAGEGVQSFTWGREGGGSAQYSLEELGLAHLSISGTSDPHQWNHCEDTGAGMPPAMDEARRIRLKYMDGGLTELGPSNVAGATAKEEGEEPEQNKAVSTVTTPPGGHDMESLIDAAPVAGVSLIPPPPPPKNAARMLALALAESAQQASYHKRPPYLQFMDLPLPPPPEEEPPPPEPSPPLPSPPPPPSPEMTAAAFPLAETPGSTSSFLITMTPYSPVRSPPPLPAQSPASAIVTPGWNPASASASITPGLSPSSQMPGSLPPEDVPLPGPNDVTPTYPNEACTPPSPPPPPPPPPPISERPSPRRHLHQRSESFPSHIVLSSTPPVPPVRTLESRLATALHSNYNEAITASNYHSFLSTMMLPSSLEDALPRHNYSTYMRSESTPEQGANYRPPYPSQAKPEDKPVMGDTYRHPYLPCKPESQELGYRQPYPSQMKPENEAYETYVNHKPAAIPKSYRAEPLHVPPYSSRCESHSSNSNLYGTYLPQGQPHSRTRNRSDYMGSMSPGLRSYSEEVPPYPTIRRVQSLHVPMQPPQPPMRTVPISRTEVPPDDEPTYCPRPVYQYKACSSSSSSDYHVTQLQPYFENGRVHYRYSPYSGSTTYLSSDGTFYDADPYSTLRLRQFPLYPSRDFASYTTRHQPKSTYRSPYPRGTHNFISRDVPPVLPPDQPRPLHISWDMEDMDRYRLQSLRRETRARQRSKGPVMSQYDNVTPSAEDMAVVDIIHLRSRSDPVKTPGLLSVAESKDNHYLGRTEADERPVPPLPLSYGNSHQDKPSLPHKQSGASRGRLQHEPNPEHRTLPKQDTGNRKASDGRTGPPFAPVEYSSKTLPSDRAPHHSLNSKCNANPQEPVRLNHKEDKERPLVRPPADNPHRDCYREDAAQFASPAVPPKPSERSHGLRETLEKDPAVFYPYQTLHGKLHGSIAALSQYDNMADYHSIPHHRPTTGQPTQNAFPLPLHGRTYATALGQGAYLATELSMQRPEAKVHAE